MEHLSIDPESRLNSGDTTAQSRCNSGRLPPILGTIMGLDLYLQQPKCDHCGHEPEAHNLAYTYNVAKMWREIYPDDDGMVYIDGLTGNEALPKLQHARDILESSPKRFKPMEPSNGWGSYDGFINFINELIELCVEYPDHVWSSWR